MEIRRSQTFLIISFRDLDSFIQKKNRKKEKETLVINENN